MISVDTRRLDAIAEGSSRLPIENQEYILTTIKGMLFTRNLLMKKVKQDRREGNGERANNNPPVF